MNDTAQLVKQSRLGNIEAFGQLYRLYAPDMQRTIGCYIQDYEAAQDILHDGFIVAYTSLAQLNDPQKFDAWLTTIMKNLSLQFLREEASHITVTLTDTPADSTDEENVAEHDMSWDEINRIIDRLPDGYGKVFRLAVLDDLTHKEIGELLGIAPHSSSSQLYHAKVMLRKMINEYRIGREVTGLLVVALMALWLGLNRQLGDEAHRLMANCAAGDDNDGKKADVTSCVRTMMMPDEALISQQKEDGQEHEIEAGVQPADTTEVPAGGVESAMAVPDDHLETDDATELLANNDIHLKGCGGCGAWSVALAYVGESGQNTDELYRVPSEEDPGLPTEGPEDMEVHERRRHYMPFVVGISFSRALSDRWNVETGVRYSFLRSDYLCESKLGITETIQRVHYVGVPLKLNYQVIGGRRLSLYGHGGVAIDIPVYATQSTVKWGGVNNKPELSKQSVSAPWQWSVEAGLGIQYRITPSMSIYAEPSLRYYFNTGDAIRTIRQDKPLEFTMPIGIRLVW